MGLLGLAVLENAVSNLLELVASKSTLADVCRLGGTLRFAGSLRRHPEDFVCNG